MSQQYRQTCASPDWLDDCDSWQADLNFVHRTSRLPPGPPIPSSSTPVGCAYGSATVQPPCKFKPPCIPFFPMRQAANNTQGPPASPCPSMHRACSPMRARRNPASMCCPAPHAHTHAQSLTSNPPSAVGSMHCAPQAVLPAVRRLPLHLAPGPPRPPQRSKRSMDATPTLPLLHLLWARSPPRPRPLPPLPLSAPLRWATGRLHVEKVGYQPRRMLRCCNGSCCAPSTVLLGTPAPPRRRPSITALTLHLHVRSSSSTQHE